MLCSFVILVFRVSAIIASANTKKGKKNTKYTVLYMFVDLLVVIIGIVNADCYTVYM